MIAACIICGKAFQEVGKVKNLPHTPRVCSKDCFITLLTLPKPSEFTKVPCNYTDKMIRFPREANTITVMRSNYERGVATYLRDNAIQFFYEPYIFYLGGYRGYTPDFFLPYSNMFIEVKGLWETGAYAKFRDFKKDFNHYTYLIDKDFMKRIKCRPKTGYVW